MKNASGDHHPYLQRLIAALDDAGGVDGATRSSLLDSARAVVRNVVTPAYERLYEAIQDLSRAAPSELGCGSTRTETRTTPTSSRITTRPNSRRARSMTSGCERWLDCAARSWRRPPSSAWMLGASFSQRYARIAQDGGSFRSQAIVAEYTRLIEEAKARLGEVVSHVPAIPVVVEANSVGGYYVAAPGDGSRPAVFYASNQGTTPHYRMPTLACHEAVPGHHLQIATAQELDLPLFRRLETYLGFTEGWALYAERLAWELGWYDLDPYANLGRLQDEMMRAVRLVVDTGIHSLRWTFEEAVAYFVENTGQSRGYAEYEVLRYAAWPGQATAYMIGMLDILDLRSREEERLGEAFDLVAFHDMLLGGGSLPLGMLDALFGVSDEDAV